jgi:hypothetical protein
MSSQRLEGEYHGAALRAVILGLADAEQLVKMILREHGLESIEPDRWYDLSTARSIYQAVARRIGSRSLKAIGLKMVETAVFPPDLKDVRSVLAGLDAAYHMNVKGHDIGGIACEFSAARSATITYSTLTPCALCLGIIEGCCRKYGARPLIDHGATGCRDRGDPSCIYRLSW